MVHPLAVQLLVDVAVAVNSSAGKTSSLRLGLLQAQDVRLLLGDQALDQRGAGADRVDVPRGDLEPVSSRAAA